MATIEICITLRGSRIQNSIRASAPGDLARQQTEERCVAEQDPSVENFRGLQAASLRQRPAVRGHRSTSKRPEGSDRREGVVSAAPVAVSDTVYPAATEARAAGARVGSRTAEGPESARKRSLRRGAHGTAAESDPSRPSEEVVRIEADTDRGGYVPTNGVADGRRPSANRVSAVDVASPLVGTDRPIAVRTIGSSSGHPVAADGKEFGPTLRTPLPLAVAPGHDREASLVGRPGPRPERKSRIRREEHRMETTRSAQTHRWAPSEMRRPSGFGVRVRPFLRV